MLLKNSREVEYTLTFLCPKFMILIKTELFKGATLHFHELFKYIFTPRDFKPKVKQAKNLRRTFSRQYRLYHIVKGISCLRAGLSYVADEEFSQIASTTAKSFRKVLVIKQEVFTEAINGKILQP